ncbi:hypothetical protein GCM10023311_00640 [Flaviramulus aquimarinus]|uniref:Uncharacterized protein n=1 Tax=Flaviramulus aquimarinus TaxID=1170456 RepID=A0ABP9END8_9FLAO
MRITKPLRGPLLCWDIYAMHLAEQAINFNKQNPNVVTYAERVSVLFDLCY